MNTKMAILFDLDGTLLDRDTSLKDFITKQYNRLKPLLGGITEKSYTERFIELDAHGLVWKDKVYQSLLSEFNITGISWQELLEDYVNNFSACCIGYAGIQTALKQLKNDGYIMGIISNGKYPFQEKNIEALGIKDYFQTILISEKEGIKKPDAAIFHRAAEKLGISASEAIYIGDNPKNDIEAAKNAGMKTIWKNNGEGNKYPIADAVFEDFSELLPIIKNLIHA